MSSDSLAAAPEVVELGGTSYCVAKCSHADLVAVRAKLKSKVPTPMEMLAKLMKEPVWADFPEDEKKELRKEAARSQMNHEAVLTDDMVFDLIASDVELASLMAWTLIKKAQPEVGFEAVQKDVAKEGAADTLGKLLKASGLLDVEKN